MEGIASKGHRLQDRHSTCQWGFNGCNTGLGLHRPILTQHSLEFACPSKKKLDQMTHTCLPQLAIPKNKNKKNKSQNRPNHTISNTNMRSYFQLITAHDESVCISKQTYHAFSEHTVYQSKKQAMRGRENDTCDSELCFWHEQFTLYVFGGGKNTHTLMMN